jgi:2-methylisocitrate lyase-like PEP mutase family enzyme
VSSSRQQPEDAAQAIRRAAEAGAVGGSIEDWDPEHGLYDREQAVDEFTLPPRLPTVWTSRSR